MSSWADMAKRTAAAPPAVAPEKQAKKQKTELPTSSSSAPSSAQNNKTKPSAQSKNNIDNKNINNRKQNTKGNGQQAVKGGSQANKTNQSAANNAGKEGQQGNKQQQPKNNNGQSAKKQQQPKPKSRKPTLKPVSLADVLAGPVGKGGPSNEKKAPRLPPPRSQPAPPQASDFPSLSSANQPTTTPAWSANNRSAVSILKRPPEGGALPAKAPSSKPKTVDKGAGATAKNKPQAVSAKQQPKNADDTSKRNVSIVTDSKEAPKSSLAASLLGARTERVLDDSEGAHDFFRLMSQGKMTAQSKGRQRVRPRKKKFSSLKKKVLEERLRQWKEQNNAGRQKRTSESPIAAMACTLCLYGFAEADLVEDDDEYEELCTNLADLAEKISKHRRVAIPRHLPDRTSTTYPCFVEFENGQLVEAAMSCWNGLSLGGETLRADPIPVPTGIVDVSEWQARCLEVESSSKNGQVTEEAESHYQVILLDILTEDDLEDEDCLEETLADIKMVGSEFGDVKNVSLDKERRSVSLSYSGGLTVAQNAVSGLERKLIGGTQVKAVLGKPTEGPKEARVILDGILEDDDLEDEECLEETVGDIRRVAEEFGILKSIVAEKDQSRVILLYEGGLQVAKSAAVELGKKVIGGKLLCAKVQNAEQWSGKRSSSTVILKGALTEDDLEDEECLEESLGDLKELAGQYGTVLSIRAEGDNVRIEFEGPRDAAHSAVSGFSGMIIGGQIIAATIDTDRMDVDYTPVINAAAGPSTTEKEPEPLFSGDKRIPDRFAECLRAPKVPVTSGPRKYATLLNDETVKPLIIEMLGELMRLQKRAIDDKNAKARRRLVMGFREVARGVRARKVKLVVSHCVLFFLGFAVLCFSDLDF